MQDIADWLKDLDLGQYIGVFAEHDIDMSVLRHLTDADLEKTGVSLGHRRKILAAIAELAGQCANALSKPQSLSLLLTWSPKAYGGTCGKTNSSFEQEA